MLLYRNISRFARCVHGVVINPGELAEIDGNVNDVHLSPVARAAVGDSDTASDAYVEPFLDTGVSKADSKAPARRRSSKASISNQEGDE